MLRLLLAGVLCAQLAGCVSPKAGTEGLQVIPGVPALGAQLRADDCAAVAMASLLAHAGRNIPATEIDGEVYDPILKGSLLADLENFAAKRGLHPRTGSGSLAQLRSLLAGGAPVLLLIDRGWGNWRRPHYVVAFGFSSSDFLVHEQAGGPTRLSAAELEKRWSKTNHLYLYLQ